MLPVLGGVLTWHLQVGKGFDFALPISGSADVGACVLGSDRGQQQLVALQAAVGWQVPIQLQTHPHSGLWPWPGPPQDLSPISASGLPSNTVHVLWARPGPGGTKMVNTWSLLLRYARWLPAQHLPCST